MAIVLNTIERYDWLYEVRNRRAFRTFWDTSRYNYSVFRTLFSLHRMWYLGIFDWAGGGVQSVLKRLDQVDSERGVRTDAEYDEISIVPEFEAFRASLAQEFKGLPEDATEENIQARIRGTLLMALSNKSGRIVLTTGNKSEMATGDCTL